MKKWVAITALTLFWIFAAHDLVGNFITNKPIDYFMAQPMGLLWVALISVGGGFITLLFCRLSPQLQHRVKLVAIAASATGVTVFAAWLVYAIARLSSEMGVQPGFGFNEGIAWSVGASAVLWFAFFRTMRRSIGAKPH
jgi:hypothetical protein